MSSQKKLVILGGGAAGVLIAMKLADAPIDITLVDNKTFYEYTPGLCSVLYEATEEKFTKHYKDITFELGPYLAKINVKFVQGKVEAIEENTVRVSGEESLHFDYLVICTGSSYADPWKTHNNDDINSRLDYLAEQRRRYKAAQNILCIGGGPVGVELVTEIAYRAPEKRVTLVDNQPTVLSSAPNGLGDHAQRIIHALPSAHSILNETASEKESGVYETNKSHTEIKTDLVYNCIGVTPNSEFLKESHPEWLNDKKQVIVDAELRVTDNIFAIGDVNSVNEPKMFYTAHMQAVHFVKNMKLLLKNGSNAHLHPYKHSKPNMIISMGPSYGVGLVSGITLTGWPLGLKKGSRIAAFSKYMIERITMNDFNLKVPVNDVLYCISRPHH